MCTAISAVPGAMCCWSQRQRQRMATRSRQQQQQRVQREWDSNSNQWIWWRTARPLIGCAVVHGHWCCRSSVNENSSRQSICIQYRRRRHGRATLNVAANGRRFHARSALAGRIRRRRVNCPKRWCHRIVWHCSMRAIIRCWASKMVSSRSRRRILERGSVEENEI